ncbi:DUF1127 domain-containing protein [Bradyrhizobium sp. WD16]|uniref:DUF1127 domain-containing protein n=1 Tax=Bradyrhizobium sp. WD16 TaxID=1521768 RepID=UPI0020A52A5D|nr:DUF1127 domain-containing protein [Bradyrhizobium sp. WD16]
MAKPLAPSLPQSLAPRRAATPAGTIVSALLHWPRTWLQRMSTRRNLAELDARQMHDVGLDAELVRRESGKPFWRA